MKKSLLLAGMMSAVVLTVASLSAETIATRFRTTDFVFSGVAAVSIPTNNGGSALTPFVTTVDNQRVVIEYNAECTVSAASTTTWVSIAIIVDGVQAAPSSTDKAHCTSTGAPGGWVSAVATGIIVVPEPGVHQVRLQGQILNGVAGDSARLDDSTVVISK